MHISHGVRLGTLTATASLAIAYIRRDITVGKIWDSWEGFLGSWLIHAIALLFLTFGIAFAVTNFQKAILGYESKLSPHGWEMRYIVATGALVTVAAIWILRHVPFHASDDW